MEPTGDLVTRATELAPGVQHGEHDLGSRLLLHLGVRAGVDGDAATVVDDLATAVGEQGHVDAAGVAGHGLVDRVVDDLVHEVVQAAGARGPDVHAGPLADGFESFEDRDVLRAVRGFRSGLRHERTDLSGAVGSDLGEASARPERAVFLLLHGVVQDACSLPVRRDINGAPQAV